MEESVKVIQWKNTHEKNVVKPAFIFCLCASFFTEMKKDEYNTWDQE